MNTDLSRFCVNRGVDVILRPTRYEGQYRCPACGGTVDLRHTHSTERKPTR